MITYWNRKEVYMGNSLTRCGEIRRLLSQSRVKYVCKIVNRQSPSHRVNRGTFLENLDGGTLYYIYVKKSDYDAATKLIQS